MFGAVALLADWLGGWSVERFQGGEIYRTRHRMSTYILSLLSRSISYSLMDGVNPELFRLGFAFESPYPPIVFVSM